MKLCSFWWFKSFLEIQFVVVIVRVYSTRSCRWRHQKNWRTLGSVTFDLTHHAPRIAKCAIRLLGALPPLWGEGAGLPCSTMSPGSWLPPYQVASWSIKLFSHKICAPLWEGDLSPHLTQGGQDQGLLHAKFHRDPSNRLATTPMLETGHTWQDRQWSNSIGQTILQTIAQIPHFRTSTGIFNPNLMVKLTYKRSFIVIVAP